MFNSEGRTFKSHVEEGLRQVKNGQHLRFINSLYRTKEVCLGAVLYDNNWMLGIRDLGCVPAGNLDYISEQLKKARPTDIEIIEEEIRERKEQIAQPGYFDDGITCWQDLLKEYNASDYDDYLEKRFNDLSEKAKKIRETTEWKESEEGKKWWAKQRTFSINMEMSPGLQKLFDHDLKWRTIIEGYKKDVEKAYANESSIRSEFNESDTIDNNE